MLYLLNQSKVEILKMINLRSRIAEVLGFETAYCFFFLSYGFEHQNIPKNLLFEDSNLNKRNHIQFYLGKAESFF